MAFRTIQPDSVVETIERLQRRIDDRFPGRGLGAVCGELADVARHAGERMKTLKRPHRWVRFGVVTIATALVVALGFLVREVKWPSLLRLLQPDDDSDAMISLLQGVDSAVNIALLAGAGLFFLLQHEERAKRKMALDDLYELRSLAHVIDMHQLTKDPTTLLAPERRTASSPDNEAMSPFELVRYLDYCSEMLSLVGKVAALYALDMRDPVVIEAISDIESMTTNLSRKIWQKITLVEQTVHTA
jgi:hypothetical protein